MKGDRLFLSQILERILLAEQFAQEGEERFRRDPMVRDAIVRELEVIGEAVKRVSPSTRELDTKIPWKQMAGFRDRAIHAYETLDEELVWRIVTNELPPLKVSIRRLMIRLGGAK
jgi:uncharacterized protein with HEPN domain